MSAGKSMIDFVQTVGYNSDMEMLVVMLSDKMARIMLEDGWRVEFNPEIGYFINIQQE